MTKKDHIKYWIKTSDDDWNRVDFMFKNKDYVFALFCVHLSIEKICKAIWVKDNVSNFPPRIHDLVRIIEGTRATLTGDEKKFLKKLTEFQLDGRYPDYQFKIYKTCNKQFAAEVIERSELVRVKLLKEKLSD